MVSSKVDSFTIGRGRIYLAQWSPAGPGQYQDVGNTPRLEVAIVTTKFEHFTSRSGIRIRDKVITKTASYSLKFDLDKIDQENLVKFLGGVISGNTISGLADFDKRYAIKFVSDNEAGIDYTYEFFKARISAGSPLNLLSHDWTSLSFLAEGELDVSNHPTNPYFEVTVRTTTTTT